MKNIILYVIFLMSVSKKRIFTLAAFLFGYSFSYYLVDILKYKNKSDKIHQFFSNYNKQYGRSYCSNYGKIKRN